MQCPKCNQSVPAGARFCASCGEPLSPAGSPDATLARPPRGPVGANVGASAGASAGANAGAAGATGSARASSGVPPGLIDRIRNILLTPKTEWPLIEAEPTTVSQLFKGYVAPLAALYALMAFIHLSIIGYAFWRMPPLSALVYAIIDFGFALLGVYLVGLIIDGLAPTFAGQRNQRQAIKTVAYAYTPSAVASVFGLLPRLGPLVQLLAGLYAIYLLYLGLPVTMRNPQEKSVGYTAAAVVCTILVFVLLGALMSVLGRIVGYSPFAGPYGFRGG